ncbi:MAG: hypothetical protein LQ346_006178 [Caloplaca aetnensis]|nr:MAG: hypothetical protein LQ346_006178 [Caloplaca aetnensis]
MQTSLASNISPSSSYERLTTAGTSTPEALPDARIIIKHPGYPDQYNSLMHFHGHDRLEQHEGIHHGTVLAACAIVSGRNDGFLASQLGGDRLELELDDLLRQGAYYFTVPDDPQYAIYPSFQHWKFPHHRLPPGWNLPGPTRHAPAPAPARTNTTTAVLARDQECLVSRHKDIMERAHLCPQQEIGWFRLNNMSQYNHSDLLSATWQTDDMSNLIALREDIHTAFDRQRMFVVVPKQGIWITHFLQPSHMLGPLYHNARARLNDEVAREHVLARFAWAIFPLVQAFVLQGPKRSIRALVTDENGYGVEENEFIDLATITSRFFPPRERSQSPKKRGRAEEGDPNAPQGRAIETRSSKRRKVDVTGDNQAMDAGKSYHQGGSDAGHGRNHTTGLPTPPTTYLTAIAAEQDHSIHSTEELRLASGSYDNGIDDPDPRVQQLYAGESRLDRLRRLEVKRRRPDHNPDLFCCDYDRKTAAVHAAVKEEGDWEASQLCAECLGGEFLPLAVEMEDNGSTPRGT